MNKREKAIWNLVIGISAILLVVFINSIAIGLFSKNGSSYNLLASRYDSYKDHLNMAGEYELPVGKELIRLFKKYNISVDDIIKKSEANDITAPTQSRLNNFREYIKTFSSGNKPYSFINGFSLDNAKIKSGKHILTEIAGDIFSEKPKCKSASNVFLKEVYFMNDNKTVQFYDLEEIKEQPDYQDKNYYYANLNNNNNLEVYINTSNEIDEYAFEVVCFEPSTSELLQSLNEFEISLTREREKNFNLSSEKNDPTDLSNVIILDGQVGYNQNKKFKTLVPTSFTNNESTGKTIVEVLYQGQTIRIEEGYEIADGKIIKINRDHFLFEKNGNIDTLKISKTITRNKRGK
ncbi:MAG: hypothetical protein CMG13_03945 [Candidatus Marinimicrobia bacterium]|nr:hypothetical protein [Candidatus Neomarinimicrobiota bacterium]